MATPTVDEIMGKIKSVNTCATNCPTCAPVIAGIRTTLEALVAERDRLREAACDMCAAVEDWARTNGTNGGILYRRSQELRTALSSNP